MIHAIIILITPAIVIRKSEIVKQPSIDEARSSRLTLYVQVSTCLIVWTSNKALGLEASWKRLVMKATFYMPWVLDCPPYAEPACAKSCYQWILGSKRNVNVCYCSLSINLDLFPESDRGFTGILLKLCKNDFRSPSEIQPPLSDWIDLKTRFLRDLITIWSQMRILKVEFLILDFRFLTLIHGDFPICLWNIRAAPYDEHKLPLCG